MSQSSLQAFGLSDVGCVRANNEDYHLICRDFGLYVIADGMGGAAAGEHASRLAVETVYEHIKNSVVVDIGTLVAAFEEANRRVRVTAAANSALEGMGTTLVALLQTGDELLIASVGDSRAYLFDGDQLTQITDDQTWVNEMGRRLGMSEANLKTHPMRHVLTAAIGADGPLSVNTYTIRTRPRAHILLCCDGLHGSVNEMKISQILGSHMPLQTKCHSLIEAAREAGGPDNITVVLAQC